MRQFRGIKHVFFTGIGGIGMSGIADIIIEYGYRVSGSDRQMSEITRYLQQRGARIYQDHHAGNITNVDLLVYTSAVKEDNPEIQEAQRRNIPQIRRAEMLAEIVRMKYCIGVAGTHGKTTTSSICGKVLQEGGLDPTIIVGGRLQPSLTNAIPGKGDFAIVEADEYDRSFLALSPAIAILTSLETDHLDIYTGLDDMKSTFLQYTAKVPFYGFVVACTDDENIRSILPRIEKDVITYAISREADYQAEHIRFKENKSIFDVLVNGQSVKDFTIEIPGEHNIKNALAAIVTGMELGISADKIKKALQKFKGIERRFEIKSVNRDIMIVDDYAHHPTEIKVTLQAAKEGWNRRIVAIFQPHLFSRTRDFYKDFAESLKLADVVILAPIYPARETEIPGISSRLILQELEKADYPDVYYFEDRSKIIPFLRNMTRKNDMLITIGAGDIWMIAEEFKQILENE